MNQWIRGTVSAEGDKIAGHNFKVVKPSQTTGAYTLIFLHDFEETPSVVATINGDGWKIVDNAHVAKVDAGQCEIHTGDYYGALADRPFSFIAVG
ncbi:hypothetical protein ABZY93_28575 [Streptomyces smyrnaeus]|uniref:hypothetical protein n=1 Tax=Streptomyces smyrnaeus TaxID=1387713 RepID=UPI0033A575A3